MIQRIFHPIGQGAFYSERHDGFNIVYDCGTAWANRSKKVFDKVVTQSFNKDEVIDILFISHFDYDHVSKIHVLRDNVKRIKKVVMPLLDEKEKNILLNIYRALNFSVLTLISNPGNFFGDDTQIIKVIPTDNRNPLDDNQNSVEIDSQIDNEIASGTILKKTFIDYEWVFIPHNYKYSDRHIELIQKLKKEGFSEKDIEQLTNDATYTIDKIIPDISMSKKKGGKVFKTIYDSLSGNINQNSMILYSGIKQDSKKWRMGAFITDNARYYNQFVDELIIHDGMVWQTYSSRISCIYTGDADLNTVDIRRVFKPYWSLIGTIQIPHHGDLRSFNKDVLDGSHYLCPISVGEYNSYGHPSSKLLADVLSKDSQPILVTENLTSCFIERISLV